MVYQTEMVMPREALPETADLFNLTEQIPPEKLYGFFQFLCGVSCGLGMAAGTAKKTSTWREYK